MEKRKDNLLKEILMMILVSLCSALLYSTAINCLVNAPNVHMLTNGIGGVSLIGARLLANFGISERVSYAVIHTGINIPIMILAFKRIGKLYATFSLANNILTSILILFIPENMLSFLNLSPETDFLIIAVLAGIMIGVSSGISFKAGFSTGGIDTLIAYIGIKYNKQVGKYSIILNGLILLCGGLIFNEWRELVYTIVMICVCSVVIDLIYIRAKKRIIKIISNKKDEVVNKLIEVSRHGITITNVEGGYSHSKKYEIETAVLADEVNNILFNIKQVDPDSFVYIIDVFDVKGRYHMPNYK